MNEWMYVCSEMHEWMNEWLTPFKSVLNAFCVLYSLVFVMLICLTKNTKKKDCVWQIL